MEWSIGLKFRSGKNSYYTCRFSLGTVYCIEWSLRAGVESDFGVAKVEWSDVCVWPSFM